MSAPNAQRTRPHIAVGPRPADWAAEAIRRGGGEVVTLDQGLSHNGTASGDIELRAAGFTVTGRSDVTELCGGRMKDLPRA